MTYSETIVKALSSCPSIKQCAYILHDKDVTEDGSIKPPHYHVVVNLLNPQRLSFFNQYKIDGDENLLCQIATCPQSCFDYLTHKHNPDKYQYDESLIQGHWTSFSKDVEVDRNAILFNDLVAIASGFGTWYDLFKRFPNYMFQVGQLKRVVEIFIEELYPERVVGFVANTIKPPNNE